MLHKRAGSPRGTRMAGPLHMLKQAVSATAHQHGYVISREPVTRFLRGMRHFEIDLVFDVGANIGQFGVDLRRAGYSGRIVSFEPLGNAHRDLVGMASRDVGWEVHPRCAIGANAGEIAINVAGNSVSSSVLPMLDAHATVAKESVYVGQEVVPIQPLDSVAPEYLRASDRLLVKIDTQGYEWEVLDGAEETLDRATGLLCELSLVPLYDGQRLWQDVIARLESRGFVLWALEPGFTDRATGRTLQVDATFFRR